MEWRRLVCCNSLFAKVAASLDDFTAESRWSSLSFLWENTGHRAATESEDMMNEWKYLTTTSSARKILVEMNENFYRRLLKRQIPLTRRLYCLSQWLCIRHVTDSNGPLLSLKECFLMFAIKKRTGERGRNPISIFCIKLFPGVFNPFLINVNLLQCKNR